MGDEPQEASGEEVVQKRAGGRGESMAPSGQVGIVIFSVLQLNQVNALAIVVLNRPRRMLSSESH